VQEKGTMHKLQAEDQIAGKQLLQQGKAATEQAL
jgi:hypothetical protein